MTGIGHDSILRLTDAGGEIVFSVPKSEKSRKNAASAK